jgi:enterochelin esterase-like enzyme
MRRRTGRLAGFLLALVCAVLPVAHTGAQTIYIPPIPPTGLESRLYDLELDSPAVFETRTYRVYFPPGYWTSDRVYPVLYLLHGVGDDYTEWSDLFVPEVADELILNEQISPFLIVMPDGRDYWANNDAGGKWADFVAYDLVQEIDSRFRTLQSPQGRAIGGLSMGGYGAISIALQHPEIFGTVGAHSPSIRFEPDEYVNGSIFGNSNPLGFLRAHPEAARSLTFWLDVGAEDGWRANTVAFSSELKRVTPSVTSLVLPGRHARDYWAEHVPDYLTFYGAALEPAFSPSGMASQPPLQEP